MKDVPKTHARKSRGPNMRRAAVGAVIASAMVLGTSTTGEAQTDSGTRTETPPAAATDAGKLDSVIDAQDKRLDEQDRRLAEQQKVIENLQKQLNALAAASGGKNPDAVDLGVIRAAGLPAANASKASPPPAQTPVLDAPQTAAAAPQQQTAPASQVPAPTMMQAAQTNPPSAPAGLPDRPVGEAPAGDSTEMRAAEVTALPEGARVLTPVHRVIAESSIEYDRASSNRLVFRGVEIVPGLQLGLVDANEVANDTVIGTEDIRYGLFDRFEIEARVPFLYRQDRLTTLSQQVSTTQPAATQTSTLEGRDIGDVELSARYQLNRGDDNSPIYVAGLRVKSTTGRGPFDVSFDTNGIATQLATGSGFWAVEPTVTMLFPSDPVVLFANIGYLHNFGRDINKTIGTTLVGNVTPGDGIDLSLGFGFALNPQFSVSFGFSNTFIFPTFTELGTTSQHANSLEVGELTMGWSYVFNQAFTISNNFEFGVTSDAPDLRVIFRFPLVF
jgi:uncharacterized coiled-coil protein SlyX